MMELLEGPTAADSAVAASDARGEKLLHMDHIIHRLNSNLSIASNDGSEASEGLSCPSTPSVEDLPAYEASEKRRPRKKPALRVYKGTFVHSTWTQPLVVLRDTIVGVKYGKIIFIEDSSCLDDLLKKYKAYSWKDSIVLDVPDPLFFMPGLVDAHAHTFPFFARGVQQVQSNKGSLEPWNRKDEKLRMVNDDRLAKQVIKDVLKQSLHHGTTAAAWHGTCVESAAIILANFIDSSRQRGQIGMDFWCSQSKEDVQMLHVTKATDVTTTISRMHRTGRVRCSVIASQQLPDWLEIKMAAIRQTLNLPIKTNACKADGSSRLEDLDKLGLLDEKTLLTNCCGLSDKDLQFIDEKGANIIHCPSSDLSSPQHRCIISALLKKKIPIALGSDLMNSNSLSMIEAIRNCVVKSHQQLEFRRHFESLENRVGHLEEHVRQLTKTDEETNEVTEQQNCVVEPLLEDVITYDEAFRMATLGGAAVMGMDNHIGNFEISKDFDALLVHPSVEDSAMVVYPPYDNTEDILQKFIFTGDDRNILQVYIAGDRVK